MKQQTGSRTRRLCLLLLALAVSNSSCGCSAATDPNTNRRDDTDSTPLKLNYTDSELAGLLDRRSRLNVDAYASITPGLDVVGNSAPTIILQAPSRQVILRGRSLDGTLNRQSLTKLHEVLRDVPETIQISLKCTRLPLNRLDEGTLAFFQSIAALPRLEEFRLHGFDGELHADYFRTLCKCRGLKLLFVGDLSQTDEAVLRDLEKLEFLDVADCRLEIFHVLARLPRIKSLFVRRPAVFSGEVTQEVAASIKQLDGRLTNYGSPLGSPVHPSLVRALSAVSSLESLWVEDIDPALPLADLEAVANLKNLKLLELMQPLTGQATQQERTRFTERYFEILEAVRIRREKAIAEQVQKTKRQSEPNPGAQSSR